MSPALVITKREIRTYFNSPIAYLVVIVFTALAGYFFFTQLFLERQAELRGFFNLMPLFFMFIVPAITMRLLAEEKGAGTLEMLITMPVRDWEVVVGKFLAAVALLAVAIGLTMIFGITVAFLGPLDKGAAIGGYLGLLLMGSAFAAIGLAASSFTKNQIVAFIIAFGVSFFLYLCGRIGSFVPSALQGLVSFLSIDGHFENLSKGVIDTRDILYYLSVIAVGLLVATTSLESRKWK